MIYGGWRYCSAKSQNFPADVWEVRAKICPHHTTVYKSSRICWASFRRITFKIGIFTYFMPFFPAVSTDFPWLVLIKTLKKNGRMANSLRPVSHYINCVLIILAGWDLYNLSQFPWLIKVTISPITCISFIFNCLMNFKFDHSNWSKVTKFDCVGLRKFIYSESRLSGVW